MCRGEVHDGPPALISDHTLLSWVPFWRRPSWKPALNCCLSLSSLVRSASRSLTKEKFFSSGKKSTSVRLSKTTEMKSPADVPVWLWVYQMARGGFQTLNLQRFKIERCRLTPRLRRVIRAAYSLQIRALEIKHKLAAFSPQTPPLLHGNPPFPLSSTREFGKGAVWSTNGTARHHYGSSWHSMPALCVHGEV